MDLKKREMAEKVSILYYEKDKSQNEIAEELGISRSYVSQLLSFAREAGIVKITINVDEFSMRMIRKDFVFKAKFPKLRSVYIMSSISEEYTQANLGKFAAPYVADMINDSNVIGINLGASVEKTVNSLETQSFSNSGSRKVVQIMGGFNNNEVYATHPNEIVKKLGSILNCDYYYLNGPVIVEQPELRKALMKENSIKQVTDLWDDIDLAIMGIGVADDRSKLFKLFNSDMTAKIRKSKVCGELNINFFDIKGGYVPLIEEHKISIPYDKLKNINKKVVICSGEYKSEAILGALRGGMIDVLVTDSATIESVEKLIEMEDGEKV
mgnify:CR=1 FL=1